MKVTKAIEILTLSNNKGIVTIGTEARLAIELGIEALKFVKQYEDVTWYLMLRCYQERQRVNISSRYAEEVIHG